MSKCSGELAMKRRYQTKTHMAVKVGGRWGEPTVKALCAVRVSTCTEDPEEVNCAVCLQYMARRDEEIVRAEAEGHRKAS